MSRKNNKDRLRSLMKHAEANADLCLAVYQIITTEELDKQVDLFKYFITNIKDIESDENLELPSRVEIDQIIECSEKGLSDLSDFVENLYKDRVSESEFYEQLWKFIQTKEHFGSEVERAIAIFNCLKYMNVPYVEMDINKALVMEQDEFEAYMNSARQSKEYQHIKRITDFSFEQKTQKFSLLLNELDSCKDYKTKVMLLILVAMGEREEGFHDAMRSMMKRAILADDEKKIRISIGG